MRTSFVLITALTVAACGGSGGPNPPGDDQPDAAVLPNGRGFIIQIPDIDITPGQEITYCYYFRTPNTETLAIKHWTSQMTPGSHHMIYYQTGTQDAGPVGTYDTACKMVGAVWTYAAQTATADLQLPTDDGTNKPLAQEIPPNTGGYFQMHYLNATDAPLKAHVKLTAEALEASVPYTKTAAYVTYQGLINIPPQSTGVTVTGTCKTPANTKFWMMSTHAHKQAVHTQVTDASTMVFQSNDWEHPGAASFAAPTFYSFSTNQLTYSCTYDNPTLRTITQGQSAQTNEMCMASGYFFPASSPQFGYSNGAGVSNCSVFSL
jgi:copper type II ascorbate-dependent monooxygenase-like protein